jgi:peptidoglycan/xylan/chitin deacetylase (PgdA/CDA1 family)
VGDVVVSVDAELAWGYHDLAEAPDRVADAREGWRTALALFEDHGVPATWAVVGHLLLEACDGRHADHPLGPEWFSCPPGEASAADDWRAPDLVGAVLDSDPDHEVGSHTFSHLPMTHERATPAAVDAELAASRSAAERFDLSLDSFVFPRNRVGHRERLADWGFACYRGTRPATWYDGSRLRPLAKLLDYSPVGRAPPLVRPAVDEFGLVNVPASLYLYSFQGPARAAARAVGRDPIVAVARRGVEKAVDGDGLFHLWLHPHNLLQPGGTERLDAVLAYVARRRAETDLRVRTMGAVARDVASGSPTAAADADARRGRNVREE